jgi:cytoskeleton protein RodZ
MVAAANAGHTGVPLYLPFSVSESVADASPEAIPELVELGMRLRRAREGRGIGVAELADRLHLGAEQLSALENADRSHLHEPVFVIAQAKRIAQALGVDIGEQIDSLRRSRLLQESMPMPQQRHNSTASAGGGATTGTADPGPAAAPAEVRDADHREDPPSGQPFPTRLAAAIATLALLLGLGLAQAVRFWSQPRPASDAVQPSPTSSKETKPAGAGVLQLRSDEPSWVEVRDPDGGVLFSGLLEKEARFRLGEGLRVLAGRPDLVTVSVSGETPRRLGDISEVKWQSFAPSR